RRRVTATGSRSAAPRVEGAAARRRTRGGCWSWPASCGGSPAPSRPWARGSARPSPAAPATGPRRRERPPAARGRQRGGSVGVGRRPFARTAAAGRRITLYGRPFTPQEGAAMSANPEQPEEPPRPGERPPGLFFWRLACPHPTPLYRGGTPPPLVRA